MENYSGGSFIDIVDNNIHDIGRFCTSTGNGQDGIFTSYPNVTIERNYIHDIGRYAVGENGCGSGSTSLDHGVYAHDNANGLTIKNNVFARNEHGWDIQLYPGGEDSVLILNNSHFCANPGQIGKIVLDLPTLTNSTIANNAVWGTGTSYIKVASGTYSNVLVENNIISNVTPTDTTPSGMTLSGNLSNTDPLFVTVPNCTVDDPLIPDAHLQSGSPAIGAGLTFSQVTTDFYGNAWSVPYNIGAVAK